MAKDRICICCNSKYKYCNNCSEYSALPKWKAEFDTEECKDVFNIMSAYNMGLADESQVKDVIAKYNITNFSKFKESISSKLNKIYSSASVEETPIIEESPVIDETPVAEEELVSVEKPYRSRRNRKFNKNNFENKANTEE